MNYELPEGALVAPGWTGDWIVGWLAALGVGARTDLRVSFTREPVPKAVFSHPDRPVTVDDIVSALFSEDELNRMAIARPATDGRDEFSRKPSFGQFSGRAVVARSQGDLFLGATVTDLTTEAELAHSPFDAAVPKGITVWERAVTCRSKVVDPDRQVAQSILGTPERVLANGLGFDPRRIAVPTVPNSDKYVDPVVEVLALAGLALFPVRGSGTKFPSVRGWKTSSGRRRAFVWPVWSTPLPGASADALLDQFWADWVSSNHHRWLGRLSVFGAYGSVPYRPTGTSDTTRAYASEELWMSC